MAAKSKRAKKVRDGSEFDVQRLSLALEPPKTTTGAYAWSLPDIVAARNAQMLGRFRQAARLAEGMRTNAALYVAFTNRCDALASIEVEMVSAGGARGEGIRSESEGSFGQTGVAISPDAARDFHGCLVNHGVAFGCNIAVPREDGSRVDCVFRYWPVEYVRWDSYERCFKTQIDGGPEETIAHGDGRWVVAQLGEHEPFKLGATVPGSLVWAVNAFAGRDHAKGSVAHGNAKVIGEMAPGVPLQQTVDGVTGLTPDAAAFLDVLKAIAQGDAPAGIIPSGAKINYLTNASTAWQVWTELKTDSAKEAARIYLGTDGTLGAGGGAPGVDISALFGVATTKIQGDRKAIERAFQTGIIEPWAAVNFGSSALAPYRKYKLPDADADAERAALATRTEAFHTEIERAKANGFVIDDAFVADTAKKHGIKAPSLPPPTTAATPTIALAPTDLAGVVSVNEARSSAGLGPLIRNGAEDPDGYITVGEYKAKKDAAAAAAPEAPAQLHALAMLASPLERLSAVLSTVETIKGKDGAPGRAGVDGANGVDGRDGINGRPGIPGKDGASGRHGKDGKDGKKGEQLSFAERNAMFYADLKDHRATKLHMDQSVVERLAKGHGVPVPTLEQE